METKLCASCRLLFRPRAQVPHQRFCPKVACQRARKRDWHKAKRRGDPDYHDNQEKAQRAWLASNPGYWREYRASHPEYVARNRAKQSDRNDRRRVRSIAKMDESPPIGLMPSGLYRITPIDASIAKMDGWIVRLVLINRMDSGVTR